MIFRRFWRDDTGNMAILFAFGFALSAVMSAIAVDAASLYHERRQLQAAVDLAAISAAAAPQRATEIARSVLADARLLPPAGTDGLTVTPGRYDPAVPQIAERFRPGQTPFNAVEVTMRRPGTLHFAAGFAEQPEMAARGIAAMTPEVSFSLGSRLASLNGGIANALLGRLLGTTLSLDVMDYRALALAEVDLLAFLDALAIELGIAAGSYDDLLRTQAGSGSLSRALARLTNGTARTVLHALGTRPGSSSTQLGNILSLGAVGDLAIGSSATTDLGVTLSALDILAASASVADGQNQLSLALGASVPGLLGLDLDLAIGEPPQGSSWLAVGPVGATVRTAQTRLRIGARLLGNGVLDRSVVNLPLWVDVAHSEARVVSATCPSPAAPRGGASIAVRPGILQLGLGQLTDAALTDFGTMPRTRPVVLVELLLARVIGTAPLEIAQTAPATLAFSSHDIASGTLKSTRTQTAVTSLVTSLLGKMEIDLQLLPGLGLGLSLTPVSRALFALLNPLAPTLDMTINAVLSTLGLGLGEADVRVHGVRCTTPVLVG